jgi:hypothetical protein
MVKIRPLAVLTAVLALMAMSAAPAGAWFKSRNQAKTTGLITLGKTSLEAGGAKATCETAAGEWSIQTKGPMQEHQVVNLQNPVNSKQVKTTFGPHLYIKISQWNNCKAEATLMKVPATVESCSFQLIQNEKGSLTAEASTLGECVVKSSLCTINVAAGNEQTGVNVFLKEIKGVNEGQKVASTAAVVGIRGKASCSAEEFTNGKFTSEEKGLKAEGLELA